MKKIISLLIVLFCFVAISCKESEIPTPATLQIERADLTFGAASSEGTVDVIAKDHFTVSCREGWLEFTVDGNRISFTLEENVSVEGRSAFLVITQGKEEVTLTISQLGDVSYSDLEGKAVFHTKGGDTTFVVQTMQKYTVELIPQEAANWLTVDHDKSTGKIKLTCSDFTDGKKTRTAVLKVNYSNQSWTVECIQRKPITRDYYIKYKSGGQEQKGECKIVETEDPSIFDMYFKIGAIENKVPFKAFLTKSGMLNIPNLQPLDELPGGGEVFFTMADLVKGFFVSSENALYGAKIDEVQRPDTISFKFQSQGVYGGYTVNSLAFVIKGVPDKDDRNLFMTDVELVERFDGEPSVFPTFPIAGEYKLKYNWFANAEVLEGKCLIKPTNNLLVFNLFFSDIKNDFKNTVPVKASYKDGKLILSSYQALDTIVYQKNEYIMRMQMIDVYRDVNNKFNGLHSATNKSVLYVAKIKKKDNGGISMKFKDVKSWTNRKVNGIAFTSYPDKKDPDKKGPDPISHAYLNNLVLEQLIPAPAPDPTPAP